MVPPKQSGSPRKRRGAAMVEFALVFLGFIVLMLGLFEGARVVWAYTTIVHAARQGVRWATVQGNTDGSPATAIEIRDRVRSNLVGIDPAQVTVNVAWVAGVAGQPNTSIGSEVAVQATHSLRTFFVAYFFGNDLIVLKTTARGTIRY